jgi:hypothetical protein
MPAEPLAPLDWNFTSCPSKEIPFLFCYEYSRELSWIEEEIETIRDSGTKPVGWHDWLEWPDRPYLWLPKNERQERLKILLNRGEEGSPLGFRVVPLIGKKKKSPANWLAVDYYPAKEDDDSIREVKAALNVHVDQFWAHRELLSQPRTRGASYHDRLRALSVNRLRQHNSVEQTLDILASAYREEPFVDETTLERAKRRMKVYLHEFDLKARLRFQCNVWFPPFGRYTITL